MKPNKKMKQAIADGKKKALTDKPEICVACNGSGRYDSTGSPKCGACGGTGKTQNSTH